MQILARTESCPHTYGWRDTGRCGTTEAEAETIRWENCSRGRCTGTGNTEDGGGPQEWNCINKQANRSSQDWKLHLKQKGGEIFWIILPSHLPLVPPIGKPIWNQLARGSGKCSSLQCRRQELFKESTRSCGTPHNANIEHDPLNHRSPQH